MYWFYVPNNLLSIKLMSFTDITTMYMHICLHVFRSLFNKIFLDINSCSIVVAYLAKLLHITLILRLFHLRQNQTLDVRPVQPI